jgi:hypothetical protein
MWFVITFLITALFIGAPAKEDNLPLPALQDHHKLITHTADFAAKVRGSFCAARGSVNGIGIPYVCSKKILEFPSYACRL